MQNQEDIKYSQTNVVQWARSENTVGLQWQIQELVLRMKPTCYPSYIANPGHPPTILHQQGLRQTKGVYSHTINDNSEDRGSLHIQYIKQVTNEYIQYDFNLYKI